MIFLNSSSELKEYLTENKPQDIAVAFIGLNWSEFIDIDHINNIIVSPGIGANPKAIADIVSRIGWKKVHFLNNLHSKLYISKEKVLVSSANLSNNGFNNNEQLEIGVAFTNPAEIKKASTLYKNYLKKAVDSYNTEQKISELQKLWEKFNNAVVSSVIKPESSTRDFTEYNSDIHEHFYTMWYVEGETDYTEKVPEPITREINNEVHFSQNDNVKAGNWVLYWKKTQQNKVNRKKECEPFWMYIHEIYNDGCDDVGYENLGIERNSFPLPNQPFEINNNFITSFMTVIESGDYDEYRDSQGEIWLAKLTTPKFKEFIKSIQNVYQQL